MFVLPVLGELLSHSPIGKNRWLLLRSPWNKGRITSIRGWVNEQAYDARLADNLEFMGRPE